MQARDLAFGTVDSWLIWQLTGGAVHATESSNASRTMLFDIRRLSGPTSCATCSVYRRPAFPRCVRRADRFGVDASVLRLPAGIPIAGVAGDQQAALFGQACFEPGMTKNTYGTGSFVLMNVGERCPDQSRACSPPSRWTLGPVPTRRTTRSRARSS